jgi:dipeptidyl aminopeptidase/acylaminoacyl peptidase
VIQHAVDRAGRLGGYDPDEASPAAAIAKLQAPVLLIHGDHDSNIPVSHSVALKALSRGRAELLIMAGANHYTISGRAELWPPTLKFFDEYLHTPSTSTNRDRTSLSGSLD